VEGGQLAKWGNSQAWESVEDARTHCAEEYPEVTGFAYHPSSGCYYPKTGFVVPAPDNSNEWRTDDGGGESGAWEFHWMSSESANIPAPTVTTVATSAADEGQAASEVVPEPPTQWSCPTCTFINEDSNSQCSMCNSARPASEVVTEREEDPNKKTETTSADKCADELSPGSRVVRGPDWKRGDEDGGPGSIGIVLAVVDMNSQPNSGVRVNWPEATQLSSSSNEMNQAVYFVNFEGRSEVRALDAPKPMGLEKGADQAFVWRKTGADGRETVQVAGDSVSITVVRSRVGAAEEEVKEETAAEEVKEETTAEEVKEDTAAPCQPDVTGMLSVSLTCSATLEKGPSSSAWKDSKELIAEIEREYSGSDLKHDAALVTHLNNKASKLGLDKDSLLTATWDTLKPTPDDLVALPVLKELADMKHPGGSGFIQARFEVIMELNRALAKTIPYVDLSLVTKPWSMASQISRCRSLIFAPLKEPLWRKALEMTQEPVAMFDLKLSRSRAARFAESGEVDHQGRAMSFSQAFRQMDTLPPMRFRVPESTDRLYNCIFMGERSHDVGGPYRESWSQYAAELQSDALPCLTRTPNGRHAVGYNRDRWVLHPGNISDTHKRLLRFLGKLMGIAIRTKQYMALNLAPFMWELIGRTEPTRAGLRGIDEMCVRSMEKIVHIEDDGVTEDMFEYVVMECFTTLTIDDRTVELLPGGADRAVTFANRAEFAGLVEGYRMHEFDAAIDCLVSGLSTVVPVPLLHLFSGDELETMVCGRPDIDVDLLQSCTDYSSCASTDAHVQFFWQVMHGFNQDERSMFLRFTWGRSRLPLTAAGFNQKFKLMSFTRNGSPDGYFPVAHTCFFQLELPRYSTLEIMREKIRYAIYNCQAIDGDDTGAGQAAAAMGWEE